MIATRIVKRVFTVSSKTATQPMYQVAVDPTQVGQIIVQRERKLPRAFPDPCPYCLCFQKIPQTFRIYHSRGVREIVIAILIVPKDSSAIKGHHTEQQSQDARVYPQREPTFASILIGATPRPMCPQKFHLQRTRRHRQHRLRIHCLCE